MSHSRISRRRLREFRPRRRCLSIALVAALATAGAMPGMPTGVARAEGDWEITPQSQQALERGLAWLAKNQGTEGNWQSNDLGLVSVGALAFLSAGHSPGRGKYGAVVDKALDYVLRNASDGKTRPLGLLNITGAQRDMYNHGLAAFVLGQAHGMTGDPRISPVLDKALKLIVDTQCEDGGWDYQARRQPNGHDLSLAVMQAKALRSAVDSGFEVPPEVVEQAIKSVRGYYRSTRGGADEEAKRGPGQFTYNGSRGTLAMSAAGVVCMQEFGQYEDWRIAKNMEVITEAIRRMKGVRRGGGQLPVDAYTLYYVGQALYQVGGEHWKDTYPILRDAVVEGQMRGGGDEGLWRDVGRIGGLPGDLYGTSVGCFILAMPNRYLPILQEGKIESLKKTAGGK